MLHFSFTEIAQIAPGDVGESVHAESNPMIQVEVVLISVNQTLLRRPWSDEIRLVHQGTPLDAQIVAHLQAQEETFR